MSMWKLTICFFFVFLVMLHVAIFDQGRQTKIRVDFLDKRIDAIERSVDILPGNNPTELPP